MTRPTSKTGPDNGVTDSQQFIGLVNIALRQSKHVPHLLDTDVQAESFQSLLGTRKSGRSPQITSVQFRVDYYHLDCIIIKEVIEDFYRISEVTWRIERFCIPLESVRKSAEQIDLPPFSADRCCVS